MNSVTRWFRKNRMKLLVAFGVLLMIGFVGGSYLSYLSRRIAMQNETVADVGDEGITQKDLAQAEQELAILRMLGSEMLLRGQGIEAIMFGELIFGQRRPEPALIQRLDQLSGQLRLAVSRRDLYKVFNAPAPNRIYWMLLTREAEKAGIVIPREEAGRILASVLPQLTGANYADVIGTIVAGHANFRGVPEERILDIFGKMISVLQYANLITSGESLTLAELTQRVSSERETFNVEYVNVAAEDFVAGVKEPTEEQIVEHFEKYKNYLPGEISTENPYGFGYKLLDRAQLEYLAVSLEDAAERAPEPTQEEMEEEYQKNIEQYTRQVHSDPDDPNSPMIDRRQSFAEVAQRIRQSLRQQRINALTSSVIRQADLLTRQNFEDLEIAPQDITSELMRQRMESYEQAAQTLSKEFAIPVYTGQTGLLTASQMRQDNTLGQLYLEMSNTDQQPVPLTRLAFSIPELDGATVASFEAPQPQMYENIGPCSEMFGKQVRMLVRVVDARKSSVPESVNVSFSTEGVDIGQEKQPDEQQEDVFSVREEVVEDLKLLAAMDQARTEAQDLVSMVTDDNWPQAIAQMNQRYREQTGADVNDPNVFELQDIKGLTRITASRIGSLQARFADDPAGEFLINNARSERVLTDKLYDLLGEDANSLQSPGRIIEFEPDMSYFVIKSLSIDELNMREYEQAKGMQLYSDELAQTQRLAVTYFDPELILERADFRWVPAEELQEEAVEPEAEDEEEI